MFSEVQTVRVVVLVIAAIASVCDLRTRRIPNSLTFGGAGLGLVYGLWQHGPWGLALSTGGWLTGVAVFLPFFLLGGMGAGDVKLLGCFGAWLGVSVVLWSALYASLAGGVMALVLAAATGYLSVALGNLRLLVVHWRVMGIRPLPELTLEGSRGPRLPFAIPISVGTLAAMWFQ
jgi:prepilin peptidase CpaA